MCVVTTNPDRASRGCLQYFCIAPTTCSPRIQWSCSVSAPGWHQDSLGGKGETAVTLGGWPTFTCLLLAIEDGK
jgi:hypothetical protein